MSEVLARDVQALATLFKAGGWQELRVECDGLSVLLSEDTGARPAGATAPAVASPVSVTQTASIATEAPSEVDPKWAAVAAPNLGTFYRSPKPGAAPFVEVGQRVEANTEICLLEVMKLFTSVQAGVAGIVRRICAADAQLVEGGQELFYIERE